MPELPEVETVRRGLAPAMEGYVLVRVQMYRPNLRYPFPDGFGQRLIGKTVKSIGRRAKFLLITLDDGTVLITHLGMSGSFRIYEATPPPLDKHDHVVFNVSNGFEIRFNDPRRFGFMDLITKDEIAKYPMLSKIGPEPVHPGLSGPELIERLKGKSASIKATLLDQSVIAGIGNIYASESLFLAGISPKRKASSVQGKQAEKLAKAINEVLLKAIEVGGSSLNDHRQTSGELGYFQHSFKVYGQVGKPCSFCGPDFLIKKTIQSGRSSFFCSRCQK